MVPGLSLGEETLQVILFLHLFFKMFMLKKKKKPELTQKGTESASRQPGEQPPTGRQCES